MNSDGCSDLFSQRASLRETKWFPNQEGCRTPPATSGCTPGSPPSLTCLEGLEGEVSLSDVQTTWTGFVGCEGASLLLWGLSGYLSSSCYLWGWAQPPYGGGPFQPLASTVRSPSFGHNPSCDGLEQISAGRFRACLSALTSSQCGKISSLLGLRPDPSVVSTVTHKWYSNSLSAPSQQW